MRTTILMFLAVVLLSSSVFGATISGQVYDLDLNELDNIAIQIDTEPKQQVISRNGNYVIELPPGMYTITATKYASGVARAEVEDSVNIQEEGDFTLDLILFPIFEELEGFEDIEALEDTKIEDEPLKWSFIRLGIVCAILFLWVIGFLIAKKVKRKPEVVEEVSDPAVEKVMMIIDEHEGRLNQRELRKALPWSEAKISIVLSQLEADGRIEKIKKGRANIIVKKE